MDSFPPLLDDVEQNARKSITTTIWSILSVSQFSISVKSVCLSA